MLKFIQGLLGSGLPIVSQHVHYTNMLTPAIDLLPWPPLKKMDDTKKKKQKKQKRLKSIFII